MSGVNNIPRPEFPNPQFERKNWLNLNGKWGFEFDYGNSGENRKLFEKETFDKEIIVPFTFESELSGINNKDFCLCVWYKRSFTVSDDWANGSVILHFGAVDYHAKVWVNGKYVGFHRGGMISFSFDVTKFVKAGENTVVVRAFDDVRSGKQPVGKQCHTYYSAGCHYTRTTGIWQTVWLEHVPSSAYIQNFKFYPDAVNGSLTINAKLSAPQKGAKFIAEAFFGGVKVSSKAVSAEYGSVSLTLDFAAKDVHLWEVGKGGLYDLKLTYGADDSAIDTVYSYFGLRSVVVDGYKVLINGKSVFQRLVLDQGFYPDGTFTAPSDQALKNDILLSIEAGFNGARLHQKIFEPRFHYHADTLGYITWGEHGNWGLDFSPESYHNFQCEWLEAVDRDFNHPSIIGWCPFNETNRSQRNDDLAYIYRVTKLADITRPVIDTSGYVHVETDIYDVHDYEQDVQKFASHYPLDGDVSKFFRNDNGYNKLADKPYFVSEFGGTWWSFTSKETRNHTQSWGYGEAPQDLEQFYTRFEGLINALLDNPRIFAFCYTQLTDVEQEQNGIYNYDRSKKFDNARLNAIMTRKAKIEE